MANQIKRYKRRMKDSMNITLRIEPTIAYPMASMHVSGLTQESKYPDSEIGIPDRNTGRIKGLYA